MASPSPLAVIQRDLLDGTAPLTRMLQKCVLLANSIGSTDLRDWARLELDGYSGVADVPDCRKLHADLCLSAQSGPNTINRQTIDPASLPAKVRELGVGNDVVIRHGIAEIEHMAAQTEPINLSIPASETLARILTDNQTNPFVVVTGVFWSVMPVTLHGIVEAVRTRLADLVGEMIRVLPSEDITPPKELADQAVHFVNSGERATIVVNTSMASGHSTSTATASPPTPAAEESWWKRLRKKGIVLTLIAAAAGVAGVLNWLHVYPWQYQGES